MNELISALYIILAWGILAGIAGSLVLVLLNGQVRLRGLFRTGDGDSSPARMQAFVVTIIIAGLYLGRTVASCTGFAGTCAFPQFDDVLGVGAGGLVAIFGASKLTYLLSKGFLGPMIKTFT